MEYSKKGYVRAQCLENLAANTKRRKLVVAQAEIGIVEDVEEDKPAEN